MAQDGILLTEAQITALEKAKSDKEAHGEFDSECLGYCGAQDTFYVVAQPRRVIQVSVSQQPGRSQPLIPHSLGEAAILSALAAVRG